MAGFNKQEIPEKVLLSKTFDFHHDDELKHRANILASIKKFTPHSNGFITM